MTQTTETRALSVYVAPEPMAPRIEVLELTIGRGRTIAAILAEAVNKGALELEDVPRVRVYVNGEALPFETALDYVPRAGDVLNLAVMPLGGGRNGNKTLATVLTIALIVLTVFIPGALPALSGPLAALVQAGVMIAGTFAIQALTAPNAGAADFQEANNRRALEGASNGYRMRQPMPLRLGRHRAAFDLAAKPYTQTVGDDVFLHVLFGVHYGPCTVEDIRIGETLLSAYPVEDISLEYALTPGPRAFAIFPGIVSQENLSDELEDGVAEVHTTEPGAERIEVDFALPGGLYIITNKGKTEAQHVHAYVELRAAGTSDPYLPADLPPVTVPGAGTLAPGSFYEALKTKDTVRRTISFVPPSPGQWDVRITKITPVEMPNSTQEDSLYWTALRSFEAGAPIVDETLSIIAMRIRSNDDLNGSLPTVSGIVEPIVPVFDGVDWDAVEPSSNPLALARWLVTGPAAARPLTDSQIDVSGEDLYDGAEALDLAGALGVLDDVAQDEVLRRLGRLGRFKTYWNGQRLCFVPDGEKVGPRQVFTGRNASGYRLRRSFPDPLHGVIVEFQTLDETKPWDEVIVYASGYDATSADLLETYRLGFMCDGDRAIREGLLYLARRILLVEVHEWQAGVDAVAATLGDRVLVRHMSSLYGEAEATVDNRTFAGGLVTGLRLDESVVMLEGFDYAIDFRRADAVIRGVPVVTVPGETRSLQFVTARAVVDSPEPGDLLAFGRIEEISEDLEVIDVDAGEDGMVAFRAIRYIADELAAAEGGTLPVFESGLSPRVAAPVPRIISAIGSPEGAVVVFDIDPKRGALVEGFAVRWRISGETELGAAYPWEALPPLGATERQVKTPAPTLATAALDETGEFHPEVAVDVELRSILRSGALSNGASATGISCIRGVPDVLGFTAAGLIRPAPDGSSYPVIEVAASARLDGIVQDLVVQILTTSTGSGEDWFSAGPPLSAAFPVGDLQSVRGGETYDVRARWRTRDNWVGDWTYEYGVEVPAGGLVAASLAGFTQADISAALAAAGAVVADVRILAEGVLSNALRLVEERDALVGLGFLPSGEAVNVGIVNETTARIEGDVAILEDVSALYLAAGDNAAAITAEATLRIAADSAEAVLREALAVAVGDNTAAIVSEATARADADTAQATLISGLTASVASANATIASEASARASADTALASSISSLSATVGGFSASISTLSGAVATLDGRTQAYYEIVAAAGSDPAYAKLLATGTGSAIVLAATELALYNVSGGTILRALKLISGQAFFGAPISIDVGSLRLTLGPAFGASSDLLFWFGSSAIAVGSMTKTNGKWAFASDGHPYLDTGTLESQLGGSGLNASVNYEAVDGHTATVPATVYTPTTTITATGGSGGYTYSWIPLGAANGMSATSPTSASTTFSGYVTAGNPAIEVGWACVVRDSAGQSVVVVVNAALFYDI